jgi:hypothetical protein
MSARGSWLTHRGAGVLPHDRPDATKAVVNAGNCERVELRLNDDFFRCGVGDFRHDPRVGRGYAKKAVVNEGEMRERV